MPELKPAESKVAEATDRGDPAYADRGETFLCCLQLTIFENNDKKYDNRHEKPKSVFDFLKTIERAHRVPLATGQS